MDESGAETQKTGEQINYERAFDMFKPGYRHIPKHLLVGSDLLKYIKPEYRDEVGGASILASSYNVDGYPTQLVVSLRDGREIGYISFGFDSFFRNERENKDPVMLLAIGRAQIKENFRKQGISTLLLATIFKYYPYLYGVRFRLGLDNYDAYKKALDQGQDAHEAFKATPAYKAISKFGFSLIDRVRSFPQNGTLVLIRPV